MDNFLSPFRIIILLLLILINNEDICSQTIGISVGGGFATLIDFPNDNHFGSTDHSSGANRFVKVDFERYLPEAQFLSFYIIYEKSTTTAITNSMIEVCGIFPTSFISDFYHKFTFHRVGVGFSPLNVHLYKGLRFKSGVELSRIFKYSVSSIYSGKDETNRFRSRPGIDPTINNFGLGAFVELYFGKIKLSDYAFVSPFYRGSLSISNEIDTKFNTKTLRNTVGIVFKSNLSVK